MPIIVNTQLANTITKIFDEIYQNQLHIPIKSASSYNYRAIASEGRDYLNTLMEQQ